MRCSILEDDDSLLNEMISLKTKEIVIDESVSEKTIEKIRKLRVLVSSQESVEPASELSYAVQDVESDLEKEVLNHLLTYVKKTQKRTLAHLQKAVHYEPAYF